MKKNEYSGSLPRNTLDLISPFHFTFDRDLKIISAGKGIEKIAPNIVGSDFSKLFQFKRPFSTQYEFDSIIKYTKQIFLLDSVDSELILRGQIIHVEQSEELIFIGSPWVTKVNDLEKYGLLITDFALNDTTPDLLHVFQAQEIAIKEIKQLVKNLDKQKRELNQSRKLYKQLVEEAGDIIFRMDGDGVISYINPIGLHVFGKEENDIIGKHFTQLIDRTFQSEALGLFNEQVLTNDITRYQEVPYKISDGTTPWYGQNINLIIENGVFKGAQVVARDITERKNFEAELLLAKEIAEESELAKEKFLANMSHEIRTPMNAIYGLANILMDKNLSNEDRESVRAINHSANNLIRIINDILDFSKIESGNVEIRQTSFDLEQVLDGVSQTLRLVALNKNIELRTLVDSNVPKELLGDPIRLRQILLNLESNAIKFTEQGHVETHVKLKHKSDEECILIFEVKDTGIGIPESKLQTIFRSFTQASDDTSRKYGGTGLGLTIAKELIELQSGTIDVHSIQGHGSTFVFTLKFELGKGLEPKAKLEERNYSLDELSGYKFLMAEDNPMNQLLAKKVFAKWNCKIDFADNGQIAIDKLNVNDYDLILMDLQMPELDGYQTTKYIRNEMRQPKSEIPIIAITAHALSGESARCISIGMNDYISKPFDQLELFEKILTIVQKSTV